jgi:hypothetical protein
VDVFDYTEEDWRTQLSSVQGRARKRCVCLSEAGSDVVVVAWGTIVTAFSVCVRLKHYNDYTHQHHETRGSMGLLGLRGSLNAMVSLRTKRCFCISSQTPHNAYSPRTRSSRNRAYSFAFAASRMLAVASSLIDTLPAAVLFASCSASPKKITSTVKSSLYRLEYGLGKVKSAHIYVSIVSKIRALRWSYLAYHISVCTSQSIADQMCRSILILHHEP